MEIRELAAADAASFWALRLRGFREDPTSFGSSFEESRRLPPGHALEILERRGRSPDDCVFGAFEGEALVGIVGLRREPRTKRSHRATLWGLYVAPEARGRGVARALARALVERARRIDGLVRVNLTVMAHNAAAIELYRSLGFEVWGREERAMRFDGTWYAELSMGLDLRSD